MNNLFAILFSHWIATLGAAITSAAAIVFVAAQFLEFTNSYIGLLIFLIVPTLFVFGLLLVPVGVFLRSRTEGSYRAALDAVRWDSARAARLAAIVLAVTLLNLVVMSAAGYRGVEYMNSDAFCGEVCHSVMSPQFEVHELSPHAEVGCVECHVGPGPSGFVEAKLAGVLRLGEMALGTYDRPLRISDANRDSVREACEKCHWSGKAQGPQLRLIRHFDQDEASTPLTTLLLMRVDDRIHGAHVGRDIEYVAADSTRQVIPMVSVDGREYVSGDVPEGPAQRMDCLDCHNRAAHNFAPLDRAADEAIASGIVGRDTPFARRDLARALEGNTPFAPNPEAIALIRSRNVFDEMAVDWGTYADNIGHENSPGCFRCHDSLHETSDGDVIEQDCFACHELLAIEEERPDILSQLGLAPD